MGLENLKTEITADVVDAVWNDNRSIGQRIIMGILGSGFGLFFMYATIFSHGKKPGLLTGILDDPELFNSNVELLWINIIAIILLFAVFGGIAAFGFRCFFCFGDRTALRDHATFMISKVAFWSFGDRWKVQTVLPFGGFSGPLWCSSEREGRQDIWNSNRYSRQVVEGFLRH